MNKQGVMRRAGHGPGTARPGSGEGGIKLHSCQVWAWAAPRMASKVVTNVSS